MDHVFHENETAVFKFNRKTLIDHLLKGENTYDAKEAGRILHHITKNDGDFKVIPSSDHYFGFIILDLLDKGEGSVLCIRCDRVYSSRDLRPINVGWGRNPFAPDTKWKGGKRKQSGKTGGRGFKCPQGHEVISKITWIT